MGVKSDKTFEEIVERLVALFKPQAPNDGDTADEQKPLALSVDTGSNLSPTSSENLSPTPSEEDKE